MNTVKHFKLLYGYDLNPFQEDFINEMRKGIKKTLVMKCRFGRPWLWDMYLEKKLAEVNKLEKILNKISTIKFEEFIIYSVKKTNERIKIQNNFTRK